MDYKLLNDDIDDYYIDAWGFEKTPYNHDSQYEQLYKTKCQNDECLNSRCVYKSIDECQLSCKTGCRMCNDGKYMCDLQ